MSLVLALVEIVDGLRVHQIRTRPVSPDEPGTPLFLSTRSARSDWSHLQASRQMSERALRSLATDRWPSIETRQR
jgi:hypothetical protein